MIVAGALALAGLTAGAEPSVSVRWVTTGDPWSTITVGYALGGTDASIDYKVAFDVTLIAVKSPGGVQLWENGPYWAECNVGATKPEEYGYYFWWGDTVCVLFEDLPNSARTVRVFDSFSFI